MKGMAAPRKRKKVLIDTELCKGCRICVAFCPEKVLDLDEHEKAFVLHPERCDGCGICELRCPDLAIEIL